MGAPDEVTDWDGEGITFPDGGDVTDGEGEEVTVPDGFLRNALIAASLGAGGIHIWAAWAHSSILRVLIFFTLVATVQLWLAAAVVWVRSIPWSVLFGGAVVNAAVVVVWVLTRTTGVPYQPDSHSSMSVAFDRAAADPGLNSGAVSHIETFGLMDTAASLLEVGVVVAVLLLWRKRRTAATGDDSAPDSAAAVSAEVHSSTP